MEDQVGSSRHHRGDDMQCTLEGLFEVCRAREDALAKKVGNHEDRNLLAVIPQPTHAVRHLIPGLRDGPRAHKLDR